MSTSAPSDTAVPTTASAPKKAAPRKASVKKAVSRKPAPKKAQAASKKAAPQKTRSRKAAAPAKPAKPAKVKKPKLVRDSYTIPKDEYAALADLKQRSAALAHAAKKSELLRAGIKALTALNDKALLAALKAVPSIKTGRPKKA